MELPASHQARLERLAILEGEIERLRERLARVRAHAEDGAPGGLEVTIVALEASHATLLRYTEEMQARAVARGTGAPSDAGGSRWHPSKSPGDKDQPRRSDHEKDGEEEESGE